MQLKVIKNDGWTEDYIQTKILRTLSNCLADFCDENISTAEQLTDAFTYHIYNLDNYNVITTAEIHSMLKAMLIQTGFEKSAVKLHDHHYSRIIKRHQLEVLDMKIESLEDAKIFCEIKNLGHCCHWNKSMIVDWLMQKYEIKYIDARAIASAVEEKILNTTQTHINTDIIKQMCLVETAEFLNARKVISEKPKRKKQTRTAAGSQVTYIAQKQNENQLAMV